MSLVLTPEEEFLAQAFKERRVAQLCIHNEYNMIHFDTRPDTEDRKIMEEFCYGLADFTKKLSPYALTVRAQYDIAVTNAVREKIAAHRELPFEPYFPKTFLSYDRKEMKVSPKKRDLITPAYIDLIDPDFNDLVLVGPDGDVLHGEMGENLIAKLHENKCDVILGTGLYAHACAKATLTHAVQAGFTVYAVTNRILNHPWNERERDKHVNIVGSYDKKIRRITDDRVLAVTA